MIGLFTLDLDLSVGTRKIKAIRRLLTQRSFDVSIHSSSYLHTDKAQMAVREMRLLCHQRPRAIICNTSDLSTDVLEVLSNYLAGGGIVVCYDRVVDIDCDQIVFDREDNTYRAAKHLLELGHRELGLFEVGSQKLYPVRLQGFTRALAEFALTPREEWFLGIGGTEEFEDRGAQMAAHFLSLSQKPTAVCIVNDYAAVGFIAELQRAGLRVPQDVSVVGHDDRPIARYCSVPLTSVSHPVEEIAQSVVDLLMERLDGGSQTPARTKTIQSELVVRESTRKFAEIDKTAG
jgi:DNA-binding LacI/PurR family transcriptional regulator